MSGESEESDEMACQCSEDSSTQGPDVDIASALEREPPDGGYGWVCAFAVFLINAHTWGINVSWAVIMAHYSTDPESKMRASHLEYGLIGGLSISQALLISPLVTALRGIICTRRILLLGSFLICLALSTSSFATNIWHLFLSQGFCFGWGMGCCYNTATAILPPWFTSRRSLAVGLATSGAGIGGLVYSIATNKIIENLDVNWAYRILSMSALVANMTASFLLREWRSTLSDTTVPGEKRLDLRIDYRDFGRIEILLIIFWGFSTEMGYIVLLYSLPTYASSIGLLPSQGSVSSAMLNLGLALGRPVVDHFSDKYGRINIAGATTVSCALLCFALWIPSKSYASLLVFSLCAGALCGTFWCTATPVLADVVGIRRLASTFAAICLSLVLPTAFAEMLAIGIVGDVDDHEFGNTSSFVEAQIFTGFMFVTGSLSLLVLRCWKIFDEALEHQSMSTAPTAPVRGKEYWISWMKPELLFAYGKV